MAESGQDHLYKKVELAGPGLDPRSGHLAVIDTGHAHAHAGYMFHASGKVATIANLATQLFHMRVPADTYPHWNRVRLTFGDGNIDIATYENSIVDVLGTPIVPKNTNRNSSNTAGMTLYAGTTFTDLGDNLHELWAPPTATQGAHVVGISDVSNGEEWIMAPLTDYAMSITNNSGGAIAYSWEMLFYEIGATP